MVGTFCATGTVTGYPRFFCFFVEFLIDELKVMDDALEAEKRVFFISAKEELIYRVSVNFGARRFNCKN